jgi:hypothetical protein
MSTGDTGKQRAARIPLDYFKRYNPLERGKLWLVAAALAVGAAYVAWGFFHGEAAARRASPGPLSDPHAAWEAQCTACHVPFQPMRPDALATRWDNESRVADQQCMTCHRSIKDTVHHSVASEEHVPRCASCHAEHRGREASLVRMHDRHCVRCHANLASHRPVSLNGGHAFADVTRFDRDHPDFRSIAADPGRLKFSHRRHLTPGLTAEPGGKGEWTLADIPETDRERYRTAEQSDGSRDREHIVHLDCASCHAGAGTAPFPAALASGSAERGDSLGAYFRPPNYEQHCRACHPLDLGPWAAAEKTGIDRQAAAAPLRSVPHGMAPGELRAYLTAVFARQVVEQTPGLLDEPLRTRPLPGKTASPEMVQARQWIDAQLDGAAGHLRIVCGKCHEFDSADPPTVAAVVPVAVPAVWLAHARFNHSSHRSVGCRHCHERAFADVANPSESRADVLVPARQTCLECHRPLERTAEGYRGGARFDCVECHRYHVK